MPPLTDLTAVRALLDRDRAWAAYAIGDLAPGFVEHCEWHASAGAAPALLLVYRGFDPPITFAMGDPSDLRGLFHEVTAPEISLHVRRETLEAMSRVYTPTHTRLLQRMALRPEAFRAASHSDVRPLGEGDLAAITALYDDGYRRDEGPTFFSQAMLRQGTFRGLWEDGALVSIAGTHLYSPALGVCAIGNIYTRSDRRGRGLAAQVTSAVVALALQQRVSTIVLNVAHDNTVAQRVYQRLGFEHYCDFLEGEATRVIDVRRSSRA